MSALFLSFEFNCVSLPRIIITMTMRNITAALLFVFAVLLVACTENISMEDRYTQTENTIITYLEKHDSTYGEYLRILGEVNVSRRSKSTLYQLLGARGHYTVFAPTNQAIQEYLDTLWRKGIITQPSWDGFTEVAKYDSILKVIAFNSILDGGDETTPYLTSTFPDDGDEFPIPNMNDRRIRICINKVNPDSIYVNGVRDSKTNQIISGSLISLKNRDIPAVNGYIHAVETVIAPSNETLGDLMTNIIASNEEGYLVLAKMLQACHMLDTLMKVKDEKYEDIMLNAELNSQPWKIPSEPTVSTLPEHRKFGYTIFAETDAFWEQALGKKPKDITMNDIRQYIQSNNLCPDGIDDDNYTSVDNALNQFLTYHMLPMRIPQNKLVMHYNERGYTYGTTNSATIPVFEYYCTMGKRRLLKIYESKETSGVVYLNRFPKLKNGRHENYHEAYCDPDKEGVAINADHLTDLVNAIIYPIDRPLAYINETRDNLMKERIRFDAASMFPEFMNNDIRGDRVGQAKNLRVAITYDAVYKYLNDAYLYDGCKFNYLSGFKMAWNNYQGDELNIIGNYEMVFRLPPVPRSGTYEIRYLVGAGSSLRGVCQVYFGHNKDANSFPLDNMVAQGIPLDLRMGGLVRATPAGSYPSIVGWEEDTEDDDYNAEVEKKMRANGFMKAPASYICYSGGTDRVARIVPTSVRRIIITQRMEPDEIYYIGFKNVLDDDQLQFYMDFLEYCPKEVYDNPFNPEDIW